MTRSTTVARKCCDEKSSRNEFQNYKKRERKPKKKKNEVIETVLKKSVSYPQCLFSRDA